jgi:hypothetical protein
MLAYLPLLITKLLEDASMPVVNVDPALGTI